MNEILNMWHQKTISLAFKVNLREKGWGLELNGQVNVVVENNISFASFD